MNKYFKILFLVLAMLILTVMVALWVYRSDILKVLLIEKTQQEGVNKVNLEIDSVYYDPFGGEVKVYNFQLSSSDFLKEQEKLPIQKLSFDSLVANKFDIFKLLFENTIKLESLKTTKPNLIIDTKRSYDTTLSVNEQFNAINQETFQNVLPIVIDRIFINYGTVKLLGDETGTKETTADFSVELFGFNTIKNQLKPDSNSFLYSDRIIISANNIEKTLDDNQKFKVSKLNFDSKMRSLVFDSIEFNNSINGESVIVNKCNIKGINIEKIKNQKKLKFESVSFDEANISYNVSKSKQTNNQNELMQLILKRIEQLDIGRIDFRKVNLNLKKSNGRNLLSILNLNAFITNVSIDSSSYNFKYLPKFDELTLKTNTFTLDTGFYLSGKTLNYKDNILQFKQLDFNKDSSYSFKIPEGKILNLIPDLLLTGKPQLVSVDLSTPEFTISQAISINSTSNGFNFYLLDSLKITDGKLNVKSKNGLFINTNKINLKFIYTNPININKFIVPDKFYIYADNLELSTEDGGKLKLKSLKSDSKISILQNGSYSRAGNGNKFDFYWESLIIKQPDYQNLLNNKRLKTDNIQLKNPVISYDLKSGLLTQKTEVDSIIINLPLSIESNLLEIRDAFAEIDFKEEKGNLNTGFNFVMENVDLDERTSIEELLNSDFKLNLTKTQFDANFIKFKSNELAINKNAKQLTVSGLKFLLFGKSKEDTSLSFYSNLINLSNLELFNSLKKEKVIADKLDISNLTGKVIQLKSNAHKSIDINDFSELDTINLSLDNFIYTSGPRKDFLLVKPTKLKWFVENSSSIFNEILIYNQGLEYSSTNLTLSIDKILSNQKDDDLNINGIRFNSFNSDSMRLYLFSPKIKITDFISNKLNTNALSVNNIISDSIILIYSNNNTTETGSFNLQNINLPFKNFSINSFILNNADISVSARRSFELNDIGLVVGDLKYSDDSRGLSINNVGLDLKDNTFYTPDSLYKLDVGSINYSFIDSSLIMSSLSLLPLKNAHEYFKIKQYQSDYVSLTTGEINFNNFDIFKFINGKKIKARSLKISNSNLSVYRDKRYAIKKGTEKPMPAELIRSIRQPFMVDSIMVTKSKILYGEYVHKSDKPGEIYFDNFNLTGTNFSNCTNCYNVNNNLNIEISTKVMGKTSLTANVNIPLNSNTFSFSGKTEEMNFSDFNSMTQNLFGISVLKGKGSLDINNVISNDSISRGDIYFKYKKLRIALYDRDKAELNKGIASPFFRFLVNDLLIKSNNPRTFGRTRKGVVYYTRDTDRSFFNYMWKSLVSGMLSTMWHNSREQRKEKRLEKKAMSLKSLE